MPKTLTAAASSTSNTLNLNLIAFKPRQVLLSRPGMASKDKDSKKTLKPDQKLLLLQEIARYLDREGFSKSFKKFVSEAEIEKKDLGATSHDLEEIFCKYLEESEHDAKDFSKDKIEDTQSKKCMDDESVVADEAKERKKKKKQKLDATNGNIAGSVEALKEKADNVLSDDGEKKHKKKKSKSDSKSLASVDSVETEETEDKAKDKKKKKSKTTSADNDDQASEGHKQEQANRVKEKEGNKYKGKKSKKEGLASESTKDDGKITEEDEANKVSKKRKRLEAEEDNAQPVENKEGEESKRRKKDAEAPKDMDKDATLNVSNGTESHAGANGLEKTPAKQPDGEANGNSEKTEKSGKKQQTGSKESKKFFQRVKLEEVEFTDERLQDNSYWAKDGAENGYGAKAQEVLGQVRGRDFRHEKTKKKRGSYRGGQIDLQSHSVKFNYSDEE